MTFGSWFWAPVNLCIYNFRELRCMKGASCMLFVSQMTLHSGGLY